MPSAIETVSLNLRRLRAQRGVSLSELARQADIAKGTLSKLENGVGNPTVETLAALAGAFGVPFGAMLADPVSGVRVVRSGDAIEVEGAGVRGRLFDQLMGRGIVEAYDVTFAAGHSREAPPHQPGTLEHLYVSSGHVRVGPIAELVELGPHDFACYAGDRPHLYETIGGGAHAILLMSVWSSR